ncbi:hypothetical protein WMF38_57490 [Sorangium sp. So ce118]
MPDVDGHVGGLYIPLKNEGYPSPVLDPAAVGLGKFLAFWIRYGLKTKLQEPNENIPDPLPAENVFPFDPKDNWVRRATPALYLWWNGESQHIKLTMIRELRRRTLRLFYVAGEQAVTPNGGRVYSGLPAAVDAILHKASAIGYHPDYAPDGFGRGTPIAEAMRLLSWEYDKGKADFAQEVPNVSPVPGGPGGGHVVRGYPVLFGNVVINEEIDLALPGADDGPRDIPLNVRINDPSVLDGAVSILDRTLESPVGANGE